MEHFIKRKLDQIFKDFKQSAVKAEGLCECKELTYKGRNLPDYNSQIIQQYYLLRFFPAYLAEYYLMYSKLIEKDFLPDNNLNVLSIGCGSGIDYWSLHFALSDFGKKYTKTIRYTGIDAIDWNYKEDFGAKKFKFHTNNIASLKWKKPFPYNVIVFPKSIGEFTNDDFKTLCELFKNTEFAKDKICGLCSLMDEGKESDAKRFRKLARIVMKKNEYECLDEMKNYWTMKKNQGIRSICSGFIYPDDILEEVKNAKELCPTYIENGESCEVNCDTLNRWPILKTKYINYKLLRFER